MSASTSHKTSAANRAPRWVNTLLVVLIGYALAVTSLKLLPQTEPVITAATPADRPAQQRPTLDKTQLSRQIASAHLFGNAAKPAPVEEKKAEPVKTTKLNLKLAGVFAYEPQERAMAIINTGGSDESAFRVGDKVIGQTTLKAVYTDHVILNNRGREERLDLPENSTPIAVRQPVAQQQTRQAATGANNNEPVVLPTTPGALRDTLAKNPALLGRVVAAEPYQENGKLRGYRITPKQNPEILEAQGIVAGDIITRVNNIELNSQKQGIRALRNAVKAQSLEVTVLRGGVEIPLSISLAQ